MKQYMLIFLLLVDILTVLGCKVPQSLCTTLALVTIVEMTAPFTMSFVLADKHPGQNALFQASFVVFFTIECIYSM